MSGNPKRRRPHPSASGDRDSADSPDQDDRSQQNVDQRTDTTHLSNVGRTRHPASESTVVLPPMRLHPAQGSTAQRRPTSSQGRSQDPPHYQPQSSLPALIGTPAQLETHRAMRQEVAAAQQPAAYVSPYGSTALIGTPAQLETHRAMRQEVAAAQQPATYVSPYGSTALIGTPAQLETHRAMRQEVAAQQPAEYVSPYGSTQPNNEGQQLQPMTKQRPPWTAEQDEALQRQKRKWPHAPSKLIAEALNNGHDADDCRQRGILLKNRDWARGEREKAKAKGVAKSKPGDKPPDKKT